MSKIHSTLQKAIEKSRGQARSDSHRSSDIVREKDANLQEGESGIFKLFQAVFPKQDVMEESRIVAAVEDRAALSAYKLLRTRVLQRMRSNNWRSILISSPGPGEGKTLTSSNLAVSLARDVNQSVLLVDLDLMRSSVAKYLGIDEDINHGIGDYLAGNAEIEDIVYTPAELERVAIVPNREAVANSSDFLSGPRMQSFLSWVKRQSDRTIVLFDMPPVLANDDVLAFSPNVDAVLLVVAQGQTNRVSLERTMEILGDCEMLGVVLNKSSDREAASPYSNY